MRSFCNPLDARRKLNVHKTSRTSSKRLMYVQFTSCVYGKVYLLNINIYDHALSSNHSDDSRKNKS